MKNSLDLSRIGIGLYQGDETDEIDHKLLTVLRESVKNGINLFDSAPNYRNLRSEKILGELVAENPLDKLIISTKGGFVPFDFSNPSLNEVEYIDENYYQKGLIEPKLFDEYYFQSFDPNYLEYQLSNSLSVLNRSYVDIYYIHNPEYLLHRVGKKAFLEVMGEVFRWLESKVKANQIKFIGISTWDGFFHIEPKEYLQLTDFLMIAERFHLLDRFKYIQFPFNFGKLNSVIEKSQVYKAQHFSLLKLIDEFKLIAISSAPFGQGKLIEYKFPESIKLIYPHMNNAEINLSFVLSSSFFASTLLGTSSLTHLNESISLWKNGNFNYDTFVKTFSL